MTRPRRGVARFWSRSLCLAPSDRGWPVPGRLQASRSHNVPPHRAYRSETRTAISTISQRRLVH